MLRYKLRIFEKLRLSLDGKPLQGLPDQDAETTSTPAPKTKRPLSELGDHKGLILRTGFTSEFKSKYQGVTLDSQSGKWMATLEVPDGEAVSLGSSFSTEQEAAEVYSKAFRAQRATLQRPAAPQQPAPMGGATPPLSSRSRAQASGPSLPAIPEDKSSSSTTFKFEIGVSGSGPHLNILKGFLDKMGREEQAIFVEKIWQVDGVKMQDNKGELRIELSSIPALKVDELIRDLRKMWKARCAINGRPTGTATPARVAGPAAPPKATAASQQTQAPGIAVAGATMTAKPTLGSIAIPWTPSTVNAVPPLPVPAAIPRSSAPVFTSGKPTATKAPPPASARIPDTAATLFSPRSSPMLSGSQVQHNAAMQDLPARHLQHGKSASQASRGPPEEGPRWPSTSAAGGMDGSAAWKEAKTSWDMNVQVATSRGFTSDHPGFSSLGQPASRGGQLVTHGWLPGTEPSKTMQVPSIPIGDTYPPGPCRQGCRCGLAFSQVCEIQRPWLDEARLAQMKMAIQNFEAHAGVVRRGSQSKMNRYEPAIGVSEVPVLPGR